MIFFTLKRWKARRLIVFLLLFFFYNLAHGQSRTVSGKIIDASTGDPLVGTSILVTGTAAGTAADVNGAFKINVPEGGSLTFKSVGYTTLTLKATFDRPMIVKLSSTAANLNEVAVVEVGYGRQKRESVGGAIATVSSKVFEDRGPINNPLESLQGQVPGVIVTRTSAQPGRENWNFQIRGATSTNSQDPLIILDGVALSSNAELNSMNPDDIDNISFLKDASAAIYGARAAFGVVLITTKRAKPGKTIIEYDGSVSRKIIGLEPTLLDVRQWGAGLVQAQLNDNYGIPATSSVWYGLGLLASNPPASGYIDISKLPGYAGSANGVLYNGIPLPAFGDVKDFTFFDTNMEKILFGNATSTQHNLSFSGSNEKSGYRVSLGYLNDGSQLQYGANGNQRYNLRFNHSYKFSDRFQLETNVSLEQNNIQQPSLYSTGSYGALSNYTQPGFPAFNAQGGGYAWGGTLSPPAELRDGGANLEKNIRALLNTTMTYNFANHLTFTGTAGYNEWFQDSRVQLKQVVLTNYAGDIVVQTNPVAGGTSAGSTPSTYYNRQNITEPYYNLVGRVAYNNTFNKIHEVGLMVGSSYERDEYDLFSAKTFDLSNDNIPSLNLGANSSAAGFVTDGETQNHYALGSYFGRATYTLKNRYTLEMLGRYDGSSKFIADNRWKFFYGGIGSWRISEESFMKNQNVVSNLKLRATYGTTGNQGGIGLYDYVQSLNVTTGALLGSSLATNVATTGNLVSLNRTWETVIKRNLGLDFGLFHDHLSGSFDIYKNENQNMLLGQTYPGTLGAGAPAQNIGDLQTHGWEGSLTWRSKVGSFSYSIGGTITYTTNTLVHYGGANVITAGYNANVEGYPLNSYFGLVYDGKIQNQAQLDAYNAAYAKAGTTNNINLIIPTPLANPSGQMSGLRPGDNMFRDVNGDGKLSIGTSTANPGDLVYLGSDDPNYTFGLNLGFQWKGFDFYSIFQGVGKRTVFRSSNWRVPFGTVSQGQTNQWIDNVWTPDNPNGYYPNLHSNVQQGSTINAYNYQASTWSIENGAYLRLKNLVVGYTLPKSIMDKMTAVSKIRFYFSGSDLWELTHIHDGWDPEATRTVSTNERYPFYRYLTLGANVTF